MAINDLNSLKDNPKDEYYTIYEDIDKELRHYAKQIASKKIYLPCDSAQSNFVRWFKDHPELKCRVVHTSDDYRKPANIRRMMDQDIIITNPPFSLMTDFLPRILRMRKRFLILAPRLSVSYQDIMPYYDKGMFHFGYNRVNNFVMPNGRIKDVPSVYWITNLRGGEQYKRLEFSKKPLSSYPRDIRTGLIVVDSVKDVPRAREMLVPPSQLPYFPPSEWHLECNHHTVVMGKNGPEERFKRIRVRKRRLG